MNSYGCIKYIKREITSSDFIEQKYSKSTSYPSLNDPWYRVNFFKSTNEVYLVFTAVKL